MKFYKNKIHVKTIPKHLEMAANEIDFIENSDSVRLTESERFKLVEYTKSLELKEKMDKFISSLNSDEQRLLKGKKRTGYAIENIRGEGRRVIVFFDGIRLKIPIKRSLLPYDTPEIYSNS